MFAIYRPTPKLHTTQYLFSMCPMIFSPISNSNSIQVTSLLQKEECERTAEEEEVLKVNDDLVKRIEKNKARRARQEERNQEVGTQFNDINWVKTGVWK